MSNNALPLVTSALGEIGVPVFNVNYTTNPVDTNFQEILNVTTLALDTVIGSNTFTVAPGHEAIIGDGIAMVNLAVPEVFLLGTILGVAGDIITIDSPINKIYPIGSIVRIANSNINVAGTPASPRIFGVAPIPGLSGNVTRMMIEIQDAQSMDFSTFGSLTSLTNGCLVRLKKADGTFINLFNWKNNGQFILRSFDHNFQEKTGGGKHSFVSRRTWAGEEKHGVVLRLDGTLGEEIQLLVQDDLTGLDYFQAVIQGHIVQEQS